MAQLLSAARTKKMTNTSCPFVPLCLGSLKLTHCISAMCPVQYAPFFQTGFAPAVEVFQRITSAPPQLTNHPNQPPKPFIPVIVQNFPGILLYMRSSEHRISQSELSGFVHISGFDFSHLTFHFSPFTFSSFHLFLASALLLSQ